MLLALAPIKKTISFFHDKNFRETQKKFSWRGLSGTAQPYRNGWIPLGKSSQSEVVSHEYRLFPHQSSGPLSAMGRHASGFDVPSSDELVGFPLKRDGEYYPRKLTGKLTKHSTVIVYKYQD